MNTNKLFFFGLWFLGSALGWVLPGRAEGPEQERAPLNSSRGIFLAGHQVQEDQEESLLLERDYSTYALSALEQAFAQFAIKNHKTIDVSSGLTFERIAALCRMEGARWGIIAITSLKDDQFFWHFAVYDGEQHFFRGYDFFSVQVRAGVFSIPVIDRSAQKLAKNWHDSLSSRGFDGRLAVTQGQRFIGKQDGVRVLFGSQDHFLEGGILMDGVLTSTFYPFTEGLPLYGKAVKDRYWPGSFVLPEGITDRIVALPPLQRKVRHSIGVGYEFRGDLFACLDVEYRFHILPDRLFLKAEWGIWNDTTRLSKAVRAQHQEYRVGTGVYMQPGRDAVFRLYAGTGLSLVTASGAVLTLADPLWLGGEYHFPHWALKLEFRLSEILGYRRDIYEPDTSGFNSYGLLGIQLKW
ncbi:MAG: hypothetical protein LBU25_01425 [Treponema sp.]|jgi:hypothetical protein|nr:hypothetical protein [Treponema sp.]